MNSLTRMTVVPALAIAFSAGTTGSVWAQNEARDKHSPTQRAKDPVRQDPNAIRENGTMPAGVDFRSCHALKGQDIVNESGDSIGDVADLVLDRGSGQVRYVVLKTGGLLNIGRKSVAVPFSSLRWNPGKDKFVLALTKDQLSQYPEFSAERWSEMMESRKEGNDSKSVTTRNDGPNSKSDGRSDSLLPDSRETPNLYAGRYDTAKKTRIEGEVTNVDRVGNGAAGEEVIVTVKTADGSMKKVSIGPSWFVSGGAAAPMRGDQIVAESYALSGDSNMYTAERVRIGDRELNAREPNGNPSWGSSSVHAGGRHYSANYWHYVLASNVRGMKVECRGTECGKVNDVIVDRNSGEVAMLSIDPNQNFLGIADTKRLVPWTVSSVALDGTVRIDATKEMILASPETPSDLSTLNMSDRTAMVFNAYHVRTPEFAAQKQTAAVPPATGGTADAWNAGGAIAASIDRGSAKTIRGTIADVTEVKFEKDATPAKAVKIRTPGGEEETILLGPAWYLNSRAANYKAGSAVTLEVYKARVDGKPYWITRSVESDGKKVALWENDRPVWDDR